MIYDAGLRYDCSVTPKPDMCSATANVCFGPMADIAVSKASAKAELFTRKFVLLDRALKFFRHTFDPIIEAVISLNWQYSNDLALPRTGTPERPMKIDSLTDGVFMCHLQVTSQRSDTMSRRYALT